MTSTPPNSPFGDANSGAYPHGSNGQPVPGVQPQPAGEPIPGMQPPGYGAPQPESASETPVGLIEEPQPSNLGVGIAVGLGLGIVATALYAFFTVQAEKEYVMLAILIGLAVGFGFSKFGRTRGAVPGILAALITLVLFFAAILFIDAGFAAKTFGIPFTDSLSISFEYFSDVIKLYFEDPLSYVFAGLTVIFAFVQGSGVTNKNK